MANLFRVIVRGSSTGSGLRGATVEPLLVFFEVLMSDVKVVLLCSLFFIYG